MMLFCREFEPSFVELDIWFPRLHSRTAPRTMPPSKTANVFTWMLPTDASVSGMADDAQGEAGTQTPLTAAAPRCSMHPSSTRRTSSTGWRPSTSPTKERLIHQRAISAQLGVSFVSLTGARRLTISVHVASDPNQSAHALLVGPPPLGSSVYELQPCKQVRFRLGDVYRSRVDPSLRSLDALANARGALAETSEAPRTQPLVRR